MSPRKNGFEAIPPRKEIPLFENVDLVTAHAEIVRTLNDKRIKESDFLNTYRDVNADIQRVRKYESENRAKQTSRERRNKAVSDLLEGLMYQGINGGGWLGENAQSILASLYDDYEHGIDQIIRFSYPETDSHAYLGLGIDVTTGNAGGVYAKFENIKLNIDAGTLGKVKYFSDPYYHGTLPRVPQAIVGIERDRVEKLALDWWANHDSLSQSPVQRLFVMQMRLQMETFASYAARKGKSDLEQLFLQDERRLQMILNQKPKQPSAMAELSDDEVYHSIHQALQMFSPSAG